MIYVQLPANHHHIKNDDPKPYIKETDEYFRIKPESHERKGERYFKRMANNNQYVVMICKELSKKHRGGKVMFGVYYIRYTTFVGNYAWCEGKYLEKIPKSEWERMFDDVTKQLR